MDAGSLTLTLLNLKGWGPKKIYEYVKENDFNYEKCVNRLVVRLSQEEKDLFKYELMKAKKTIQINKEKGINVVTIFDNNFPKSLYIFPDKCVFLYYKGNIELLKMKKIAIIGTRKPDDFFADKGKKATYYFAKQGYVIVSGLALGCDTIAHESCLKVDGKTIAVLPASCDNILPSSNKKLAEEIIAKEGLLISEYGTGTTVSKFNYPRRDRIQSLLSSTILIIQSSDEGGTMIATEKSIRDGKQVFAIKGNKLKRVQNYIDVNSLDDLKDIESWIY